jgi:hypothetical protein
MYEIQSLLHCLFCMQHHFELTRRMLRLYALVSAGNGESGAANGTAKERRLKCIEDLRFIAVCLESDDLRGSYASRLYQLGLVELCQFITIRNFFSRPRRHVGRRSVAASASGNENGVEGNKTGSDDDDDDDVELHRKAGLRLALSIAVNLTDDSSDACRRVIDVGFHKNLFAMLRHSSLDPEVVGAEFGSWHRSLADSIMSTLYNVVQVRLIDFHCDGCNFLVH